MTLGSSWAILLWVVIIIATITVAILALRRGQRRAVPRHPTSKPRPSGDTSG